MMRMVVLDGGAQGVEAPMQGDGHWRLSRWALRKDRRARGFERLGSAR